MPSKVVVGAQWGNEGKGKMIDILAAKADVVVRAQGGNNAGHTVEAAGEVYKLHLIPSGILYPRTLCGIGCGVVLNPGALIGEIDGLRARGVACDMLRIDPRAHMVMPWHIALDAMTERRLGDQKIGTTGRGIGPCYMDKAERSGLRVCDLMDPALLEKKIHMTGEAKNDILTRLYGRPPFDLDAVTEEYMAYGKQLLPLIADVSVLIWEALRAGKQVLFEGAQGTLLDIDVGTYPYVTSSNPVAGGVCTGAGVGPTCIGEVLGVAKAYTTCIGEGAFPTEMCDAIGDRIRETGQEFGATTGRPRRVGWFDAVMVRHAIRVNGMTGLSLNKLDTLCGVGPLKICTGYKTAAGTLLQDFPPSLELLATCTPVYEEVPGFEGPIGDCTCFDRLPENAWAYVRRIEEHCACSVVMVGVGPGREQNLCRFDTLSQR